jgi:F0F1-type ATP synthase membrane subunit c/vacuolar-type H+-ATPase subunit K
MSLLNHQEQTLFIAVIMISVALVSLMILMIYQNIHIFIQYHASLLAIETMEGYTPLSKYFYFVKSTVVLFISTFLISLLCHSYFIYTLIIHLILMTLWGMTYLLSIKKFERKNIIHLLKGTF